MNHSYGHRKSHLFLFIFIIAAFSMYEAKQLINSDLMDIHSSEKSDKMDLKDRIDLAMLQDFEATMDPETGQVPRERLMDAYAVIRQQELERKQGKAAIGSITWDERGPSNVGGRTRCMIFDAADATNKTVFAGSVAGGLFKTTDIFADDVQWSPVNDFFGNMAVTTIAQDPSNSSILYFGTGEAYFNSDAVRGDGIWKSTNGGSTWSQLSSTTGSDFDYVTKIIVDSDGNVIVGTKSQWINRGGVYRSTNGGTSFTEELERYTATSTSEYDRCADLEMAADGKTFYASFGISSTDGIFKSTDSAKTWSKIYNADDSSEQRIELVCAPSNASYIYALVQGSGSAIKKIMKSIDGGTTWTICTTISWTDQCSSSSTDFTRGQSWYNLIGAVDPNDEKILYVGGINLFRTADTGTTWTQLSSWVGCGGYSQVHSDHHAFLFYPNSSDTLLNGNDGGVYITKECQTTKPSWTAINNGFNVTQFYACAVHPTALSNYFLTGAQDNGAQRFQNPGINITDEVTGGDGAYCHIDQEDPDTQMTAYTYNNIRISTDGFTTYSSSSSSKGNFINSSDYDSENKILYAGSDAGYLYRWAGVGGTLTATNMSISAMNSKQASAILVSPFHPKTVYVGTEGARVVKVSNANGSPSGANVSTGLPASGTVSCIAMDPNDSTHLLVTYSNYSTTSVYESTNSGTSWTSVEGNLPDMPVRSAIFSPIGGDSAMIATELGVWSTTNLNGGSTNWASTSTGMSNCRVDMLQYRASDSLIVAATHGRGVFTTRDFSERVVPDFGVEHTVVYAGTTVEFFDDSYGATSWSWDFDNDGIAESTSQNPTYVYGDGGFYSVKLTINGSTSKTRTDYIQVIPNQGVPYTTSDGGDMESNAWHFGGRIVSGGTQIWERGAPSNHFTSSYYNGSNAWVTDLDADMTDSDIECELLTPNFNFSASGTYTLSFKKSMEIQYSNAPMASRVEYSTNKGKTWTLLGSNTSGGTGWFNRGPGGTEISYHVFGDGIGWTNNYTKSTASHDVSSLAGNENVCFRVLWKVSNNFSSGYARAGFLVDDFAIAGPANDSLTGAGIESAIAEKTLALGGNATVNFFSPSGKIIAKIWNNTSHDFGNTKVEVDATGTTPTNFDTNTMAVNKIFGKTIKITPANNSTSKSVKIAMYFSSAELAAWKSATGLNANDIQLLKTTGGIESSSVAQGTLPNATTVDSTFDGTNICITGTFSNGFSGVGGGGGANGGGPLPVTLLNFEGKRFASEVALDWATASEQENSHFDIERSVNGGEFEKIGRVSGNGNSVQKLEYQYVDRDNLIIHDNRLCYRLRQVDFDGAYEMSGVVCLAKDDVHIDLHVGPNPTTNVINVSINPWVVDLYTLELFDLNGNIILTKSKLGVENAIDVSDVSSGVYFVNIKENGASVFVKKIIVQ
jgi:trimeric autotransporter adhesin